MDTIVTLCMHVDDVPLDHNTIITTLLAQGAPLECRHSIKLK